jgi:hypothetical protein
MYCNLIKLISWYNPYSSKTYNITTKKIKFANITINHNQFDKFNIKYNKNIKYKKI